MKLKIETDKRINVYSLWEGRQLILCKKVKKGTSYKGKLWVALWPSKSDEKQMLQREEPEYSNQFSLSDKGYELLKKYINNNIYNQFIATVEYISCNCKSRDLWKRLKDIGEFELWDIEQGPIKYFENSKNCYIALYRVFKTNYEINRNDIIKDKNGNLLSWNKKINENKSELLFENLQDMSPVVNDDELQKKKR